MKKKVYFRADAGQNIGYGHFIRSLALADMLKDDFDCSFFTQTPTEYQRQEAERVCPLVALPADDSKFGLFLEQLKGDEIVVLDNYFFTSEYQLQIKQKGCKLVCIDDMHDKHFYADAVINHGLTDSDLFDIEPYTKLTLGLDYALLRKPFLIQTNINKEEGHWFVSFGGTDYDNMTAKFVGFLESDPTVRSITVVIGDAYKHRYSLDAFHKIEIKKNLTADQMQQEMARAEFAVLPSSSVCIEAISCGCKIASGYFVDNQRDYAVFMANGRHIYPLGNLYNWQGDSFIREMTKYEFNERGDFSEIPSRYIQLFNQL
ncbi:MAG: UDP-2,4-diacetamido-2,4,6-trideoxy-beta-L-altropyranose hydrolase [Prevotellaceae bacterium]|nr:UDP-2,4-diacetamido-2,4,6-trideoxy-beta-L-altropyranose hydrolase [Candidatus Faecinaster equi]